MESKDGRWPLAAGLLRSHAGPASAPAYFNAIKHVDLKRERLEFIFGALSNQPLDLATIANP